MTELFEKALQHDPSYVQATLELAGHYRAHGELSDCIRVLSAGAAASPSDVNVINALGQVLATTQDDTLRNCDRAFQLLQRAATLTSGQDAAVLGNLAAALACLEHFEDSVRVAEEAMRRAPPDDQFLQERLRKQLELFRARQKYVDPAL
jgi:Tfp pilus assembly protein PilF